MEYLITNEYNQIHIEQAGIRTFISLSKRIGGKKDFDS
jgi:hypothetical protein